jgi:RNA polymerase sigma-70 factor (ECF subfamily)
VLPAQPAAADAADAAPAADPGELVRRVHSEHSGAVLAYALRLTAGDRHHAEDIVQETLLRAWRNADALASDGRSVRGWLMRVAHNVTVDGYRARRARPDEVGLDSVAECGVADGADRVLAAIEVSRALDRLTPEHRAVLVEVYLNDRTAPETAGILGIPVGTVKSRTYYALRVLRLLLDEERERAR